MKRLLISIFSAILILSGCNKKIFVRKDLENWESEKLPDAKNRIYSLYLIGDAGEPYNKEINLQIISDIIQTDSTSSLIFLGDNIYNAGLPPKGFPERPEAEEKLNRELEVVKNYKGKTYFIPGNHDWDFMGRQGWIRIKEQEKYIEEYLKDPDSFFPGGGCPGPVRVSATQDIALIFIDTQWWLHSYNKPYGGSSECSAADETDFLVQLRDAVNRNKGRHIVIFGHHPLFSNGNHGGYYNILDHIFPLRILEHRWFMYFPLPVFGSAYPLFRIFGGSKQDLSNYRYQLLKRELMKIFNDYDDIIYACGHDHSLQYFKVDDLHHIISGSGSKVNPVKAGGDAIFIQKDWGFSRISFYSTGEAWVEFFTPGHDSTEAEISFRSRLYKKPGIIPESYCTLSRKDYTDSTVKISASKNYTAGPLKKAILGKHYRKIWSTPVTVPVLDLATEKGGLIPYALGGGKQSLSLKLENINGERFVAHTIDKDLSLGAISPDLKHTIVFDVAQDQISAENPYAALTIPPLAHAVKTLHTKPSIVFIPQDSCLGPYLELFANHMVLFEEDPDESHTHCPNLGNSSNIIGTEKLKEKLRNDNDNTVNQRAFARARLLDMFIGDWDRHEGQYRWAEFEKKDKGNFYLPVPEDRDQVYFNFDGLVPATLGNKLLHSRFQNFQENIRNLKSLNSQAIEMDRRFLSSLSQQDWIEIADSMSAELTDSVIDFAIRQMPQPIFDLQGEKIIRILKSRRDNLAKTAKDYHKIVSKYVNIFGSNKYEYFRIDRLDCDSTRVRILKINKDGERKQTLFDQTFDGKETKEIRLYGLGGADDFVVSGDVPNGIKIRIIGGDGIDTLIDKSHVKGLEDKTLFYDSKNGNITHFDSETNNKLSYDLHVNDAGQDHFFFNKTSPLLGLSYNQGDGFFIGTGLNYSRYKFRTEPYGQNQKFIASFASATGSWRFQYFGDFRKVFGKTDFSIYADSYLPYFAMNYFGYGNSSPAKQQNIEYYRVRMYYGILYPAFVRHFTKFFEIGIGPKLEFFNLVKNNNSSVEKDYSTNSDLYLPHYYMGAKAYFKLGGKDNSVNPTRGAVLSGEMNANQGLNLSKNFYTHFKTDFVLYLTPNLPWQLTFAARIGAAANTGDFYFYQANYLGGFSALRGYYKSRFVGNKSFYQNVELRSELFRFRTYLLVGKLGATVFLDNGRVWPGGGHYHTTYGAGPWISIYDKFVFSTYYGISPESNRIIFRIGFYY